MIPLPGDSNNDRIVGGTDVKIERIPWQLSLRLRHRHLCGATLVTLNRAISSAGCLDPRINATFYNIMAGSTSRLGDVNSKLVRVSRFIRHPNYIARVNRNDIAVLWLATSLIYGTNIRPISIPSQGESVPYGSVAIVSGW